MKGYGIGEILSGLAWQRWAQLAFNTQVLRCPYGWGFTGTPEKIEDEQVCVCRMGVVACPRDGFRLEFRRQ